MKKQIARDGFKQSKTNITKFTKKTLNQNKNVRIVSAYDRSVYMIKNDQGIGPMSEIDAIDMMNTDQLIGSMSDNKARNYSPRSAKNAINDAETLVHKKRPMISRSSDPIESSPKNIILNTPKNK